MSVYYDPETDAHLAVGNHAVAHERALKMIDFLRGQVDTWSALAAAWPDLALPLVYSAARNAARYGLLVLLLEANQRGRDEHKR